MQSRWVQVPANARYSSLWVRSRITGSLPNRRILNPFSTSSGSFEKPASTRLVSASGMSGGLTKRATGYSTAAARAPNDELSNQLRIFRRVASVIGSRLTFRLSVTRFWQSVRDGGKTTNHPSGWRRLAAGDRAAAQAGAQLGWRPGTVCGVPPASAFDGVEASCCRCRPRSRRSVISA